MPTFHGRRRAAAALLLGTLTSCGGGGGGPKAPASTTTSLAMGLVASTVPTRRTVTISNVADAPASVLSGAVSGPFHFDPADVPTVLAARASADVGVVFTPTVIGLATGSVSATLDLGGGLSSTATIDVTADAEPVTYTLLEPAIAFGEVLLGTTRTRTVHLRNDATVSPMILTGAAVPLGFTLISPTPLPSSAAPGAELTVTLEHTATTVGATTDQLSLAVTNAGAPIALPVTATTGGEVVTDFGAKTLDASLRTAVMTVDVAADAISLSIEGVTAPGTVVGLAELIGPSGKVYENTSATGAYTWVPGDEVFSPTLPNTDKPAIQLEPGGGTYSFRLFRMQGTATTMNVRAIVERRPGDNAAVGRLDLDVWLANVLTPKASTAANDTRLQAILASLDTILAQSGIQIGDIRYHDITNPVYDDVTDPEFGPMLKLTSAEPDARMNLFFVRTALGGGVLGVSATLAGPRRNGTELSGVMSLYDSGYSASFIGLVAAHELGHFLGLYHTVESNGAHDFVDDTSECPSSGTNAACPTAGGGYLMHWQAVGGSAISSGQSRVIIGHPCIETDLPAITTLRASRVDARTADDVALLAQSPPETWCATCARCRTPKGK